MRHALACSLAVLGCAAQPNIGFAVRASTDAVAGVAVQVVVSGADSRGLPASFSGPLHFTSSDSRAVLPADSTVSLAASASKAFTVTLVTAGAQTITVAGPKVSHAVDVAVSAGAPSRLSATFAGPCSPFDLTVSAGDAYGNVTAGYRGTVHFSGGTAPPADYAFTGADAGRHVFRVPGDAPQVRGIVAEDSSSGVASSGAAAPPGWCSVGPDTGLPVALAVDPDDPQTVYAATSGGTYRSRDAGASWSAFDDGILGQRFDYTLLAVQGSPSAIYLGARGGVYSLSGGAAKWTLLSTSINQGGDAQALAADPNHPGTLYVGTGPGVNGLGVLRSTNSGASWLRISQGLSCDGVADLSVDPATSAVYAACGAGGLWRAAYPVASWSRQGTPGTNVQKVFVSATGTLLIEVDYTVYASFDGGATWAQPLDKPTTAFAQAPGEPSTVYAATGYGMYVSTDAGAHWTSGGLPTDYLRSLAVAPDGSAIYAGLTWNGVARSSDRGATWSSSASGMRAGNVTALIAASGAIFAGTWSTVWRSPDQAGTWNVTGLGLNSVGAMAVDGATIYAMPVSGAVARSTDSGATWTQFPAPPSQGLSLTVDPSRPGTLYEGSLDGVAKSTDGGATWTTSGLSGSEVWSVAVDPAASLVYARNSSGFFRSADAGATWVASGAGLAASQYVHPIFVAADGTVFAGDNQKIQRSTDHGSTFTAAKTPGTFFYLLSMVADASGVLYAGAIDAIARSSDGGLTWSDVSAGLPPSGQFNALLVDPADPSVVYAATAGASVYRTVSGGE